MRRFLFWVFLILAGFWTILVWGSMIGATPDPHQIGWMSNGEKAGTAIGMIVVLFAWAIVAVPLGLFALILKPKNRLRNVGRSSVFRLPDEYSCFCYRRLAWSFKL